MKRRSSQHYQASSGVSIDGGRVRAAPRQRSRKAPHEVTRGRASIALSLAFVLAMSVSACKLTQNPDGGWTGEFAPDMVIQAMTIKSAHDQLYVLWQSCLSGAWKRPCTREEIRDIKSSYDKLTDLLKLKGFLPRTS